jgi:cyclopropane-fatty-acyl-phospholipid synthase
MSTSSVFLESPFLDRSAKPLSGRSHSPGWFEQRVVNHLQSLRHGRLTLQTAAHSWEFGDAESDLSARLIVNDPRCFRDIVFGGALGAAEAYLRGHWTTDDLTGLLRIFCRQLDRSSLMDRSLARIAGGLARGRHWLARNTRAGSRRNIAAHYDLGNDFFELFLDPTMMYSSALFESDVQSLEEASLAKLDRICRTLDLKPDDHVIEVGTGWGGFALHAARNYGCRVTTTTISARQFELARRRVADAGLSHQVDVRRQDYRDLEGRFDKLVSIEMIEAVGHAFLPTYFHACDRLLRPGGRMLIQAITMPDQRYEQYRRGTDFIRNYIFPGGHLPSVGAMQRAAAGRTQLQLVETITFPESYARTLREWRTRFFDRLDDVRALGFDERFIRMWDYYLSYCESAFLERVVSVGQFCWEKPRY